MIARCTKPNHPKFPRYGGRGIVVCEAWMASFHKFLADVGERPFPNASIGRINNDGNYEPSNVRWETPTQQMRNTSWNRQVTINDETKTVSTWASENGLNWKTLWGRIEDGWPPERLLLPVGQYAKKLTAEHVAEIRSLKKSRVKMKDIATRFGITVSMVDKITNGDAWKVPAKEAVAA